VSKNRIIKKIIRIKGCGSQTKSTLDNALSKFLNDHETEN